MTTDVQYMVKTRFDVLPQRRPVRPGRREGRRQRPHTSGHYRPLRLRSAEGLAEAHRDGRGRHRAVQAKG
jgi:hypothetical protein